MEDISKPSKKGKKGKQSKISDDDSDVECTMNKAGVDLTKLSNEVLEDLKEGSIY